MPELLERARVPEASVWRMEDMYPDLAAWEADFKRATALIDALPDFSGKLRQREARLEALSAQARAAQIVERLYAYARMKRDEDSAQAVYQALSDRAEALGVSLGEKTAYLRPELLALPPQTLQADAADPDFSDYDFYLRELNRARAHTLSASEERLVAMAGEMGASSSTIFDMLTEADMKFPEVPDGEGGTLQITQSNYVPTMMSAPRPLRKAVFEAFYGAFRAYASTIPAIYRASVKSDVFFARAAKFQTAREASLFDSDIPLSVYDGLIDAARRSIPLLTRYLACNARLLGLKKLAMYDVYVPAAKAFSISLSYDAAFDLVTDCLGGALGGAYAQVLEQARRGRWIDPFENKNKHPGAYAWGAYGVHPYVLLNYKENLDGVTTLAHELGHAMHTWYSNREQPFMKADYSLFAAEVASTVNEVLVVLTLLERHPEKEAQAYLLGHLLDSYRTTLFRQTMFAEFERETHRMAEAGEPLTGETLNALYARLNAEYYPGCEQNPEIQYEWMRIPHFYRAFYVYVYATGFSAATAIAATLREEGQPAADRYLRFLKAGGQHAAHRGAEIGGRGHDHAGTGRKGAGAL